LSAAREKISRPWVESRALLAVAIAGKRHPPVGSGIVVGNTLKHDLGAEPFGDERTVGLQDLNDTGTDGAEAYEADVYLFHSSILTIYLQAPF
jgi:hypothetical protein